MKPFNLEEALQGKPVQLRNGNKAFIVFKHDNNVLCRDKPFPYHLMGYSVQQNETIECNALSWTLEGRIFTGDTLCGQDIIGMWEEPTPTVTVTLPKPFKPKKGEQYFTIVTKSKYDPLSIVDTYNFKTPTDNDLINQGNAFKKEEDAQAWIDAMKNALSE